MLKTLLADLDNFKNYSRFDKGSVMIEDFKYENEYVKVLRIDSSNKWVGKPHDSDMDKQWGIIIEIKKEFTHLVNYKTLSSKMDMQITKVCKGVNSGKHGLRIYHMAQNPNKEIIKQILDFIFS